MTLESDQLLKVIRMLGCKLADVFIDLKNKLGATVESDTGD